MLVSTRFRRGLLRAFAALTTLLLAAGTVTACAPETPDPAPHDGVHDITPVLDPRPHIVGDGGATIEKDRVRVAVPAGAVAEGEDLTVRVGPDLGLAAGPYLDEWFGSAVQIEHASPLQKQVEIVWDLAGHPVEELAEVILVRWDEEAEAWRASEEEIAYDPASATITASVQEFSIVTWLSTSAAHTSQFFGELFGGRSAAPSCTGALPAWVDGTLRPDEDLSAVPLRVCFQSGRDDAVLAKIVNNRPYAQFVAFDTTVSADLPLSLDATLFVWNALHAVTDRTVVVLPPNTEVAVTIPRPASTGHHMITGAGRITGLSVFGDVLAMGVGSLPIGGTDNPLLNAFLQVAYECGGRQLVDIALGSDQLVAHVMDSITGCAEEIMRPDSEFGQRFEQLSRDLIAQAGSGPDGLSDAAWVLQANRVVHVLSRWAAALKALRITQYVAELTAGLATGDTLLSVRGRGLAQQLGKWTPTCTDPAADSDLLFRNLALQDRFADTSFEYWQFPDWESAGLAAVAPLAACSPEHRAALAALLPDDWGDRTAASVVADQIRALDGRPPLSSNAGLGVTELPDRAVWLHQVRATTGQSSATSAPVTIHRLENTLTFPNSTTQWVGCSGDTAETVYRLDGAYRTLSFAFGLRDHTPDGLTAQIRITGDGRELAATSVTVGSVLSRAELDVAGVDQLTVSVRTDDRCTISSVAYGAFLDTWLGS